MSESDELKDRARARQSDAVGKSVAAHPVRTQRAGARGRARARLEERVVALSQRRLAAADAARLIDHLLHMLHKADGRLDSQRTLALLMRLVRRWHPHRFDRADLLSLIEAVALYAHDER